MMVVLLFLVFKCSTHCFLSKERVYQHFSYINKFRCNRKPVYGKRRLCALQICNYDGTTDCQSVLPRLELDRIAPCQKLIDINTSIIVTRPHAVMDMPSVNLPYPMAASMPLKLILLFAEFRGVHVN